MESLTEITAEKIEHYLAITAQALAKVDPVSPAKSFMGKVAADYLRMATDYHNDAKHFAAKGDHVRAFATVNYAHGWLDAGVRLGVFDVGDDDVLFTLP